MTNFDKMIEVFPKDYERFSAPPEWLMREYYPPKIANKDAFYFYFGEDGNVMSSWNIWEKTWEKINV